MNILLTRNLTTTTKFKINYLSQLIIKKSAFGRKVSMVMILEVFFKHTERNLRAMVNTQESKNVWGKTIIQQNPQRYNEEI